jgi:hypothetical protein
LREVRRLRVFENRVLRGIFGAKRDEVTGEWRKLHNAELNDLECSPNIIRVVKSRRWARQVARMGKRRGACGVWRGKLSERDNSMYPGVDIKIILRLIFRNLDVVAWSGFMWLRIRTGGGHL